VGEDGGAAARLRAAIRSVPDFPETGILFRDITPLLADGPLLQEAVRAMAAAAPDAEAVVGIESRGFIFGAPIACLVGAGFVPVRKMGRLPGATERESYDLEYGANTMEIHRDGLRPGQRVLLVDDVLATGGTMGAAARLVERLGARVVAVSVLIELAALDGRSRLAGHRVSSLVVY
jgi:adenine phosphoribosyltransferase